MRFLVRFAAVLAVCLVVPAGATAASERQPDRYDLANGCYALRSVALDRYVAKTADGYAATSASPGGAEPFFLEPPELGRYLLYGPGRDFLAVNGSGDGVESAAEPSDRAEWAVKQSGGGFTLTSIAAAKPLAVGGDGAVGLAGDARFAFEPAKGCTDYPEVDVSAVGEPAGGPTSYGETAGLVDAHMHMMAFRFLGGAVHCGRPWHRYGVEYALDDCPDHYPNGGGAVLENALAGGDRPTHDPVGWPTFKDWPAPDSLTHEQSYYKWLERAWMGGLRVFVNLMVDNEQLCDVYPLKANRPNPCHEMATVRLEIQDIYEMQNYIDAQSGGPGEGWFRIVKNPHQARRVINDGKLAVILGIEVSKLFDCGVYNDAPDPGCDRASIDRQLDAVHDAGIRQMELVNKFDNALSGVAGDSGIIGPPVNAANFKETGSFWRMQTCTGPEHAHDRTQETNTGQLPSQDAIFGASGGLQAFGVPSGVVPVYPPAPHCNERGLTDLGEYLLRQMIKRKMIFDPDHMSVKARNQALAFMGSKDYGGIVSSHSWSTPDSFPEIYRAGGFIAPYAGGAEGFVHAWQDTKPLRDKRFFFGMGYGADANGFGNQGAPRNPAIAPPVRYPFRSFDGSVELQQQRSGERVYDINTDGVAHYGLYPDWIQDLRMIGGDAIIKDMGRGAEAYLQMWERAEGIPGPDCRSTFARFTGGGLGELRLGDRPKQVLKRAGQPERRTRTWKWCVDGRKNRDATLSAVFSGGGKLILAGTSARGHRALGVSVGERAGAVGKRADSIGGGLHVGDLGGSKVVYGVRGGRIDFIAVTTGKIAGKPKTLRRSLKRSAL
jgi:hypothetical protein